MNKCYTYYEEIEEINTCKTRKCTQKELIDLCRKSWERNGWDLVVLGHSDAEKHDFFSEYSQTIIKLPTVNPIKYEYSCFIRWLAMAQVGGGLMIDYDVINMGLVNLEAKKDEITIYQRHVPCVVYGTSEQYLDMCKNFCKLKEEFILENQTPHTSDMIMLGGGKIKFNNLRTVVDYPNKGVLVHCSQAHCNNNGKTKIEAMKELVNL